MVVIKDRKKSPAFSHLEDQPGVRTLQFDQLWPPASISKTANESDNQDSLLSSANSSHHTHAEYSAAEIEAMTKIQHLWRSVFLKIRNRRSYVSIPLYRVTARFFNLGAQCADTVRRGDRKAIQKLLLSHGVALSLRLETANALLSKLQQDAMSCIESVELVQDVDRSVDDVLCRNRDVEALLKKAEEKLSDEYLERVVKEGVSCVLEQALKEVQEVMTEVEKGTLEARRMVDALLRNCT